MPDIVNDALFKHPYINVGYKNPPTVKWRSYMEATGGGFNRGGIQGPVKLPAGMELWKCSANSVPTGNNRLSEWWCARKPFMQQSTEMRRAIEEAALNGVPFNVYVRVASCVKVEWNTLDKLQIIKLLKPAKALWGKFAPMKVHDVASEKSQYWKDGNRAALADMATRGYNPAQGDAILGGMGSYQLFIPGLTGNDVRLIGEADAGSNDAIKRLLNIQRLPSGPTDLAWQR